MSSETKTRTGNFFEDFAVGREIVHATPRTVTEGEVAFYTALFGGRFAVNSSDPFAGSLGLGGAPVDSMLAFHIIFGKTVPDISLNAIANLGYANGSFGVPVFAGDTLSATSTVIGVKENKDGKTGVVYVRSIGANQVGEMVLDYVRWVMVRKRDPASPAPTPVIPPLDDAVDVTALYIPFNIEPGAFDTALSGSPYLWDDYEVGEKIDHVDGITIEEAEHTMAAKLFQNTARVHFNQHVEKEGRFGRRIVYGGYIISMARALSFNGLANSLCLCAINGGRHTAPAFAGDTIYAWSEILERIEIPEREDIGALRIRTVAVKDRACGDFPFQDASGAYEAGVVLDFDYSILMPRRS